MEAALLADDTIKLVLALLASLLTDDTMKLVLALLASAGAMELSADNFKTEVFESGKNAFVKFLAPW